MKKNLIATGIFSLILMLFVACSDGIVKMLTEKPIVEWVSIPAGTFTMGSPQSEWGEWDNETQHQVTLSAFKMSKYEVTFEQYDIFCEATDRMKPNDNGWGRGNRPVINVDWHEAAAFAEWMGCRLPTEAEWEYACRAGTTTSFNTGNFLTISEANYWSSQTMPVGSFEPNAWGLCDMHGNVAEWCSDWFGKYSSDKQINPTGPATGFNHVLRGGSWCNNMNSCRSAKRNGKPGAGARNIGFRLVLPSK